MTTRSFVQAIKRVIDLLFGVISVVILFVPILVLALLVRLESAGPAFFRQERVGKDLRVFRIWKFRTLVHDEHRQGPQPPPGINDPQVTRLGRVLRKYGIDELPQLFNVISGDMSFVGPRPMLAYRAALLNADEAHRFDVRPGMTGLAVIRGRNALSWDEKISLDLWYVDHHSLWLDSKIVFRTPLFLLRAKGVHMDPSESLVEHGADSMIPNEGNRAFSDSKDGKGASA